MLFVVVVVVLGVEHHVAVVAFLVFILKNA